MAVGDIYRINLYYNVGSELTQNVFHLREKTACTDPIPAATVANAVSTIWITVFEIDLFSVEVYVPLIRAIRISPNPSVPSVSILGAATINGANASQPVPSTSALLVSLYSNTFTANGRGRMYIPGVAAIQQNDGQLLDAALTLANTLANTIEADWTPTGGTGVWELGVWSRETTTFSKCTQAVAHSNLATQRGRRNHPGIGV